VSGVLSVLAHGFADAAVPFALAALGGIVSERSGVANVALEASLLTGAFAASVVAAAGGSLALAFAFAAAVGGACGLVHAAFAVWGRASSIVVGMALNLGAVGVTKGLLRVVYGSSANGPAFSVRLGDGTGLAVVLVAAVAIAYALERSAFGVRLRAVGADAARAERVGFAPRHVRSIALTVGHALAALGGAALVLASGQFQSQMSAGRGFLALALVILGRWEVAPTLLGVSCLAALEASEVFVQEALGLPSELVLALPYLAMLPVLALGAGRMQGARIPRFEG
jgi:simple sugar transport system permease protein